jgi:hypothetical protein
MKAEHFESNFKIETLKKKLTRAHDTNRELLVELEVLRQISKGEKSENRELQDKLGGIDHQMSQF